jgi:N-acetylglutamate synthase-like GNAT family acetyltransferase
MVIRDIDPASPAFVARAVEDWMETKPVSVSLAILAELDLLVGVEGSLCRQSVRPFSVEYRTGCGGTAFACRPRELHQAARAALDRYREEVARSLALRGAPGSPLPIRLRRATEEDFPALLTFVREIPELQALGPDERWRSRLYGWLLARQDTSLFLLAHDEGEPAGFAYTTWKEADRGRLCALAVHPRVRRRGVGTHLLSECLRVFRREGVRSVSVVVPATAREFLGARGGIVRQECLSAEFVLRQRPAPSKPSVNDLGVLHLRRDALRAEVLRVERAIEALGDQMARKACPFRIGQVVQSALPPRGRFRVVEINCGDIRDEGASVEWRLRGSLVVAEGDPDLYETEFSEADYHFGSLRSAE